MIKNLLKHIVPRALPPTIRNYQILSRGYGQYKTIRTGECVDADGYPIPWYTYPAIEYLNQLDLSEKRIFEFGSGNSTLYYARRCRELVAVEDDTEWYKKIKAKLPGDTSTHLLNELGPEYVNSICRQDQPFDIIVIDGILRYQCAEQAIGKLRSDGFIILDNSDWHGKTSQLLRDADLIEVDMAGFGPINGYTWTTSFYLSRRVKLAPAHDQQPAHGVGSHRLRESDPSPSETGPYST